jgi:tRNA G18 (ribose-2'-O)-methylase SpoU
MHFIEDAADARLDEYREICERDQRGEAARPGLFVGEQWLIVEKMLSVAGLTRSVLVLRSHADRIASLASPDVSILVVEPEVMDEVAGYHVHRGVLAIGLRPPHDRLTIDAVVPRDAASLTVLLCEDVNNMDNIGMLFRNAAAFGVDAVVLSPTCHDPLYRKSLRVSIGHAISMPWARSAAWRDDLQRLKFEWNLTLIGAAVGANALPLDSIERPQRVGLVVGHEFHGLSEATLSLCDSIVRIPMACGVDSLNVATAAAVCLHRLSTGARQ